MLWYIGFNIQGCVAQPRTRFKRLLHMACYMRLYKFFFHSTIVRQGEATKLGYFLDGYDFTA